jgi:hypothetical protein
MPKTSFWVLEFLFGRSLYSEVPGVGWMFWTPWYAFCILFHPLFFSFVHKSTIMSLCCLDRRYQSHCLYFWVCGNINMISYNVTISFNYALFEPSSTFLLLSP